VILIGWSRSVQRGKLRWGKQDFDAAGLAGAPSYESALFKLNNHAVNAGGRDTEKVLHIGLGRRTSVQLRVRVDVCEVLPLFVREGRGRRRGGHDAPFLIGCCFDQEAASMNARYVVELTKDESDHLSSLTRGGKGKVRRIKRAQILLAANARASDEDIARGVGVGTSTVYRTKRRFVEEGLEQALSEDPRPGAPRKLSVNHEALLVATACSTPPKGRAHWTCELKEVREEVLSRGGRYKKLTDKLMVKEVVVGDGEKRRRYVLCFNPSEAERQKKRRAEVLNELHELLLAHKSRNARAKWTAAVRASQRTGPYLSVSASGELYVDGNKIEAAEKLDGKWVVMTNDDTLSTEEVATSYRAMAVIERCFRSLKSAQIEIRPMFHRANRRIEAHVKICVLSLLIQRIAERECKRPWPRLHESLRKLQATELKADGKQFFRSNLMPAEADSIFKTLKIQPPKQILGVS
jgi:transposase